MLKLYQAQALAEQLKAELQPYCKRIEIAGSIRRQKDICNEIELVCLPKIIPVTTGLFEDDFARTVNKYQKIKGELDGKYTQRQVPLGNDNFVKLNLFIANADNWGYLMVTRTSSSSFNKWLGERWQKRGYLCKNGMLWQNGKAIKLREEKELFKLLKVSDHFSDPIAREWVGSSKANFGF